jgi:hypothetical protein
MTRLNRRSYSALLASVIILLCSSLAHAQDPMAKWKPNVGDKFICTVSHYSWCGDWKCEGLDTVMFEVKDTAFNGNNQFKNAVLALTTPIGLHFTMYAWGPNGYAGTPETLSYPDTTILSLPSSTKAVTSFIGYRPESHVWLTTLTFEHDSSVVFQGRTYSARYAQQGLFAPEIGWFLSLSGYDGGGTCWSYCTKVDWYLSLLAAIKLYDAVPAAITSNAQIIANEGMLLFRNVNASDFTLSDLLGRPVRSWQFAASDGPREITLNVADVPSGVYFLRLQGDGVDEVKRVAVIH